MLYPHKPCPGFPRNQNSTVPFKSHFHGKHYLGCQLHVGPWQPQVGQPQVGLDDAYCPRMEVRTKVGV